MQFTGAAWNPGETVDDSAQPLGSSDVGNVSQVIPVIQPMIRISDVPVAGHSIEKREASCSETGLQSIVLGAEALALTALELIRNRNCWQRLNRNIQRLLLRSSETPFQNMKNMV